MKLLDASTILLAASLIIGTSNSAEARPAINNLRFEISTQLTRPGAKPLYNHNGSSYEEVITTNESVCLESMALPTISAGWPHIYTTEIIANNSARSAGKIDIRALNSPDSSRVCQLVGYARTESGERVLFHRDVMASLTLESKELSVSGGLGVFGALLNTVTLGLSNAVFGAVDNVTAAAYDGYGGTNLQTSFVTAIKRKSAPETILNDLILLQCGIEAAEMAKMACPNSKIASQQTYLNAVRRNYQGFIQRYR